MNERIKEIWQQAADASAAYPSGQNNSWETQVNFMDKFAELIVMECADIAKHHVMNISTYADADFVDEQIKQHFGVEE